MVVWQSQVNGIVGENAQRRVNVMELLYVLATAKSHRTTNDKDLINWDEEYDIIILIEIDES